MWLTLNHDSAERAAALPQGSGRARRLRRSVTEAPRALPASAKTPLIDGDHARVSLKERRGDVDELARAARSPPCERRSGHDGGARGEGAHAVADAVGLAVDDADRRERRGKGVGADLGDDGLDALPERGGAGHHLDAAGLFERDADAVEGAKAALLDEVAEAEADQLARLSPRGNLVRSAS